MPQMCRGIQRVDDLRVLKRVPTLLQKETRLLDTPARFGPRITCVNRFDRQPKAGHFAQRIYAGSEACDGHIQMIAFLPGGMRQHGANRRKIGGDPCQGQVIYRITAFFV